MWADADREYTFRGKVFKQAFQLMPRMTPFYTQWESDTNPDDFFTTFAAKHWSVPIICVIVYVSFCYFGPKMMEGRKAFDLRNTLICWNWLLCIFSTIGALRTVPHLLYYVTNWSLEDSICIPAPETYGPGFRATGLWTGLFIYSKIPELVDTLFIVLRKKPLIFLHWYHHVTVLLYCWHAYTTEAGSGLYFIAMNYSVHAVMYGYYAFTAMKLVPKWFPSYIITIGQISQMFVGTFICGASWYYVKFTDRPCSNDYSNLVAGALMYGSYLFLFVEFAVKKFLFSSSPVVDKTEKKD